MILRVEHKQVSMLFLYTKKVVLAHILFFSDSCFHHPSSQGSVPKFHQRRRVSMGGSTWDSGKTTNVEWIDESVATVSLL